MSWKNDRTPNYSARLNHDSMSNNNSEDGEIGEVGEEDGEISFEIQQRQQHLSHHHTNTIINKNQPHPLSNTPRPPPPPPLHSFGFAAPARGPRGTNFVDNANNRTDSAAAVAGGGRGWRGRGGFRAGGASGRGSARHTSFGTLPPPAQPILPPQTQHPRSHSLTGTFPTGPRGVRPSDPRFRGTTPQPHPQQPVMESSLLQTPQLPQPPQEISQQVQQQLQLLPPPPPPLPIVQQHLPRRDSSFRNDDIYSPSLSNAELASQQQRNNNNNNTPFATRLQPPPSRPDFATSNTDTFRFQRGGRRNSDFANHTSAPFSRSDSFRSASNNMNNMDPQPVPSSYFNSNNNNTTINHESTSLQPLPPPPPPPLLPPSSSFRGYGGPHSSPSRGRGGSSHFRGGPTRSGSFSGKRGNQRDPRFDDDNNNTTTTMPAPPLFQSRKIPPPLSRSVLDGEGAVVGSNGNNYTRNDAWNNNNNNNSNSPLTRSSPHVSPRYTKSTLDLLPQAPTSTSNDSSSIIAGPAPAPTSKSTQTTTSMIDCTKPQPLPSSTDEAPSSLLISSLGLAELQSIAAVEKVVLEVCDIIGETSHAKEAENKSHVRVLPSKQQILTAVSKMDARIKKTQKEVDAMKNDAFKALQDEEEQRKNAKEEAIATATRQMEAKLLAQNERRCEQMKVQEVELQDIIQKRTAEFQAERSTIVQELEGKLQAVKDEEEKKSREALNEQMIMTADNFDRDILKMQTELTRRQEIVKKTESKLMNAENDFREKMEHYSTKKGVNTSVTMVGRKVTPKPTDLVARIIAENQRRAAEAHLIQRCFVAPIEPMDAEQTTMMTTLENTKDPTHNITIAEWSLATKQVTGLADALYTEPSEAPYYEHNECMHEVIAPIVTEYVRAKQNRLRQHFTELAEEYEYRRDAHTRDLNSRITEKRKISTVVPVRQSISNVAGGNGGKPPNQPILESAGVRTSSNPYRRARGRGEIRSEYEQEQILAELVAQDAMQKRIEFGGCTMPRQIGFLEQSLNGTFIRTFEAHKVDLIEQEIQLANTNVWTDMEKSIYLDRWLQFPKDFKKIASYLRNKTTKDCVRFYYDSKQTVRYKGALREHIMRRKRRGDFYVWDATIEAALSVGAHIETGTSEEKPLVFYLPATDHTYNTRKFHPMKLEIFDSMKIDEKVAAKKLEEEENESARVGLKPMKRPSPQPLFILDKAQRKHLKVQKSSPPEESAIKKSRSRMSLPETDEETEDLTGMDESGHSPQRKAPQKWTAAEKKIFHNTLEEHGRNWSMLADAVGTKSISQIKNYYYDYKKQGRCRVSEKKPGRPTGRPKKLEEDQVTPPPDAQADSFVSGKTAIEEVASRDEGHVYDALSTPVPLQAPPVTEATYDFEKLLAQYPHLDRFQLQQQQRPSHPFQVGIGDSRTDHIFQPSDYDRALSRSGTSTPDATDLWAQVHAMQQQQNHPMSGDTGSQLMHHHSHSQHQQLLSHLLPWMNSGQLSHGHGQQHTGQHASAQQQQEWETQQQLQLLLEQEQLRLQQEQSHHQSRNDQLAALRFNSLTGLSTQGGSGLGQHPSHVQQLQQYTQQQQQQQQQQSFGNMHQRFDSQQQHQQDPRGNQQIADLAALLLLSQQQGRQHRG